MKCLYCDNAARKKGMCSVHYRRVERHGDPHHVNPRGNKSTLPDTHAEAWRTAHLTKFISRSWGKMEQRNYERDTPRYRGQR